MLLLIDILVVCSAVAVGFMTGNWMMSGVIIAGGAAVLAVVFITLQATRKGADENAVG